LYSKNGDKCKLCSDNRTKIRIYLYPTTVIQTKSEDPAAEAARFRFQ